MTALPPPGPERDAHFMRLALAEAPKGNVSPNPHVGAVIVDDAGEVLGRGFHPEPGREHAEIAALRKAGERARGATLYVTLEPCNHHGRTPPCTDAILAAGLARVVVGVRDPNPHVAGRGNDKLRAHGVAISEGVEAEASARVIAAWAKHVRTRRPFVRLKMAASFDGRIAAAPQGAALGVSRWITGPESRRAVHAMRAAADAIAVGIGTALADDPALTPRDVPPIEGRPFPKRIVLDSRARLPEHSALVRTAHETPTWIVVGDDAPGDALDSLAAHGVRVIRVPRNDGGVDLQAALDALGAADVVDLMVEGGARLAGALVAADLVDELHWFVAPIALGERAAASLVGLAPASPGAAPRFAFDRVERVGDDVHLVLSRSAPNARP